MATITCFEDIEAWKQARTFCNLPGSLIEHGKVRNNFGFIDQADLASGSTMDNIAEGFERGSRAACIVLLGYAKGSAGEVRSQLYRALDRKYFSQEAFNEMYAGIIYISSGIQKFIAYLNSSCVSSTRKKKGNVQPTSNLEP